MGLVYYEMRITLAAQLVFQADKTEEYIQKEIEAVMGVMPRGTKFIDRRSSVRPQTDLFTAIDLVFEHPTFEDGTRIELAWVRDVFKDPNNDNRMEPINVLLGIKYINPNGVPRYGTHL